MVTDDVLECLPISQEQEERESALLRKYYSDIVDLSEVPTYNYLVENDFNVRGWYTSVWISGGRSFIDHCVPDDGYRGIGGRPLDGLYREWRPNGNLTNVFARKDGVKEGYALSFHDNGTLKRSVFFSKGRNCGLVEGWNDQGDLMYRRAILDGRFLCHQEVKRFRLSKCQEVALGYYQPVRVKEGWLQLDLDGHVRLFNEDPSNIHDEVYDLARRNVSELRGDIERFGGDPSKYILIKPVEETQRMLFGINDVGESVTQRKGIKL